MAYPAPALAGMPLRAPPGLMPMPLKVEISATSPLWRRVGCDAASGSCETDDEQPATSASGSEASRSWTLFLDPLLLSGSEAKRVARTPLRSQAAPFLPAGTCQQDCSRPTRPLRSQAVPGRCVPQQEPPGEEEKTTVMLCNLPPDATRDKLIETLDSMGFAKQFDFVYVPMNIKDISCMGYGFVNMSTHALARRLMLMFERFTGWVSEYPVQACKVRWSFSHGIHANIKRNRNSPIMHDSVPDICKPLLLKDGVRIPFPQPVKQLRSMRMHRSLPLRKPDRM